MSHRRMMSASGLHLSNAGIDKATEQKEELCTSDSRPHEAKYSAPLFR